MRINKNQVRLQIITLLLICMTTWSAIAQNKEGLSKKVLTLDKSTVWKTKEVLDYIESKGFKLAYSSNDLNLSLAIQFSYGSYSIEDLLQNIIEKTDLKYVIKKRKIFLVIDKSCIDNFIIVSGFVREAISRETLIDGIVYDPESKKGIATNDYGFYSLKLKKGTKYLVANSLGYKKQVFTIPEGKENITHDFNLMLGSHTLSEVLVKPIFTSVDLSNCELISNKDMEFSTSLLGEKDFVKSLRTKSGVISGAEGTGGFSVRGGNYSHNLVLIDGIPVYNFNHLGGIFSIFNSEAIKQVYFYNGSFPAKYNGRLSSVLDIRTKDGNMKEYHGNVSVNPLVLSAFVEGPIIRNKMSFVAALRRSFIDAFFTGVRLNLYDLNIKTNYILDSENRFFFSLYSGHDKFALDDDIFGGFDSFGLDWGNLLGTFRWNHVHSTKLFQETSVTYSAYDNHIGSNHFVDEDINLEVNNRIYDVAIKTQFQYSVSNHWSHTFGLKLNYLHFQYPLTPINADYTEDAFPKILKDNSIHAVGFWEGQWLPTDYLNIRAGLNTTSYFVRQKQYHYLLPRFVISYHPWMNTEFYMSYSRLTQFQHEITLGAIALPNELRAPSSVEIAPERSNVVEAGINVDLEKFGHIKLQAYKKELKGIIRYRDGQIVYSDYVASRFEDRIHIGNRRVKGFDFQYKVKGKLAGFEVSYGWMTSEDRYKELNDGDFFSSNGDIRNRINALINCNISSSVQLFTSAGYSTGVPVTLPEYTMPNIDEVIGIQNYEDVGKVNYQVKEPNNYRLRDNYYVNIGGCYTRTTKRENKWKVNFGINNLVANPYSFMLSSTIDSNENKVEINEMKLMNCFPYLGFSYSF